MKFLIVLLLIFNCINVKADIPPLHYYTYKNRFGITKNMTSDLPPEYMKSRGYIHVMSITNRKKISYSSTMNQKIHQLARLRNTDEWLIQAVILSQQGIPVNISNLDGTLIISNTIETLGRRYTENLPNNFNDALVVVAQRMEKDINNQVNKVGPFFFRQEIESAGHQILRKLRINTNFTGTGNFNEDLTAAAKMLETKIKEINYSMNDIMKDLLKTAKKVQQKYEARGNR